MKKVIIIGAGEIGSAAASMLSHIHEEPGCEDYNVTLADYDSRKLGGYDNTLVLDVDNHRKLNEAIKGQDIVLSALSLDKNIKVAEVSLQQGASYFDMSEDVESFKRIQELSEKAKEGQYFVPGCGLAPGFVSIIAEAMAGDFYLLEKLKIRVGSLPLNPTNRLKYNIMWSVDGLINEYSNPCAVIRDKQIEFVDPLTQLEHLHINGVDYEAFTTSGGIGSLCDSMQGKVGELDYKTIRYPGHLEYIKFLLEDMQLKYDRETLTDLLSGLPTTKEDVVIVGIYGEGWKHDKAPYREEKSYVLVVKGGHFYDAGCHLKAIQASTAGGVCAMIDILHNEWEQGDKIPAGVDHLPGRGMIRQEYIPYPVFRYNRFVTSFIYNGHQ